MKGNGISTQIKKMRINDWVDLIKLGISFIPGKIWKLFSPHMWVIGEYSRLARDNGYWTFRYIRENYPRQKVYYPIRHNCTDYQKVSVLGNIIEFDSFKHCMLFWACAVYIQTAQSGAFPCRRITEDLVNWNFHGFKNILLNHGFTRGLSPVVNSDTTNYDAIFTCSEKDAKIIIEDNNNDPQKVRNVGYSRHDTLNNNLLNKKQILIMPTWRKWIDYRLLHSKKEKEANIKRFLSSSYYLRFQSLINNVDLINFLESNGITLIFYLHEYAQEYTKYFKCNSSNVLIGKSNEYSIQELLNSSALLITDYSSVCYDFSYMKKPIIYYQFDLDEFERYQYAQGPHFSYSEDGFGEVVVDEINLIDAIVELYNVEFKMKEKFAIRVDSFFTFHDNNNCSRVYKEIKSIAGDK